MIEMEDIRKSFRLGVAQTEILKGISLTIGAGEFVSIMGPSGSGKSTLSSILGCLARPSSGRFSIDGKNVGELTSSELARLRSGKIGFIFQDFNLLEGLSAMENVSLPLFYAGVRAGERKKRALECLRQVGLEERANHLPKQLSGGQKQRVAIARALINNPAFLFADEPTGALDKKTGQEIMGLLQKLNLLGHTVVQVTHSSIDAGFSKRILHLVDGLIVKDELVERPVMGDVTEETSEAEFPARLWRIVQAMNPELVDGSIYDELLRISQIPSLAVEAVRTILASQIPQRESLTCEFLKHDSWMVRTEVMKNVLLLAKETALSHCISVLGDPNAWVRYLGISQLRKLGSLPLTDSMKDKILSALTDSDERVRASAASLVGYWREKTLIPRLVNAVEDEDGRVRANAIDSLRLIDNANPLDPLVLECGKRHLNDKSNRARANAALLIYGEAPEESLSALTLMLVSENNLMRASAAWGLGLIPSTKAADLLFQTLKTEKEELVLNQLVRSLAKLAPKHFQILEYFTNRESRGHQRAA